MFTFFNKISNRITYALTLFGQCTAIFGHFCWRIAPTSKGQFWLDVMHTKAKRRIRGWVMRHYASILFLWSEVTCVLRWSIRFGRLVFFSFETCAFSCQASCHDLKWGKNKIAELFGFLRFLTKHLAWLFKKNFWIALMPIEKQIMIYWSFPIDILL